MKVQVPTRKQLFIWYIQFSMLVLLIFTSLQVDAQSWQQHYNNAIKAYGSSDYSGALNEAEEALGIASSNQEKLFTLKLLSATCNDAGEYEKGLGYSTQEISLCKSEAVPDSLYINSLNTMVNNYLGLGEYQNALPYQHQMVKLAGRHYSQEHLALNQYRSDLGYSLLMTENYDSAVIYLKEANKYLINDENGAEDFLYNQLNIGQAYYRKGDLLPALSSFRSLIDILESNGLDEFPIYPESLEAKGLVEYSMENFAAAEVSLETASTRYVALGLTAKDLQSLNEQLSVIYLKNDNLPKSDSVQSLYSDSGVKENLLVNQISLAYTKYADGENLEAKQILQKVISSIESTTGSRELLAEAYMLNTRVSLMLSGKAEIKEIEDAINIFNEANQNVKTAEANLVKAKVLQAQGSQIKAIESFLTAKSIAEKLPGDEFLKYNIYLDLLDTYLQSRNVTEANNLYQETVSSQQLDNTEYAGKLASTYAILLQNAGYNLQAKAVLETSIAGKSYPELLTYQQALAKVLLDLGQIKKSYTLYLEINNYYEQQSRTKSAAYGENLTHLGRVNVLLGDFGKAEGFYGNGIKTLESDQNTSSAVFASVYNSYAIFQQTIGNFDKAKLYYSKAKFFAKDNPALQIDIIQNLATLSQYEKQYQDAILLYKEALPAYASLYGKNHPYYATALQNLANAYNKSGDPVKGISLIEEALEIDRKNGLDVSVSYTNKLHNLAIILQETDELTRSKSILLTVLANRRNLLGENHPDYIYTLYNLAVLTQKSGDFTDSKKYFNQAIAKYDFQIESFFPYLSEQEKSKYYAKIKEAFTAYQDFAVEYSSIDPSINGDLLDFQLNHKAILLKSSKSIRKIIEQSKDQELLALFEEWSDLKTNLAKYYSMSQQELILAGISVDEVAAEANALEKQLSLKSELFETSIPQANTGWKTIQSKLKPDEAAIELIRIKKNIRNDSIWYVGLIIKPDQEIPELIIIENGKQLENRSIKLYNNSIKFKRKDSQSYNAFWKKLDDQLTDVQKIYVSCDGVYNKLNISTLYNPETDKYVLDQMVVRYLTNTIDLIKDTPAIALTDNFSLELIGNPDFMANSADDYAISSLPGTKIELETIDSLVSSLNIDPLILMGQSASEENIKKVESPNILHIATHGFFLPDNIASDDMYSIDSNPLMRSGLLLSGSQGSYRGDHIEYGGSLDSEDGILTAYEAINLDLYGTDLVILSACETGLGEIKNGEGVYGLQRSFIIAGANSVLISLWKVDDNSTKELMIHFYQNILNGIDKFEALNLAQKKIKTKYELPYYWGAFLLSGI